MLQSLHHSVLHLGELGMLGALAVGTGFWWFGRTAKETKLPEMGKIDREKVEGAIAQAQAVITQLETEAEGRVTNAKLREQVGQLVAEIDRQEIHLAVTGGKAVGKTTLIQVLKSNWVPQQQQKLDLQETPALFTATDLTIQPSSLKGKVSDSPPLLGEGLEERSDLVLFVTNGDLTDPEYQTLKQLVRANHRPVLVFNKQDQYLPEEGATVLQQLRQRMLSMMMAEDVVAIAASPSPIKVRQHSSDGSVQEWMETPTPDMSVLTGRLSEILAQESQQLVWTTTFRTAGALKAEAKTALNEVRRDRALPVIEQFQWIAAATAFANPVPALDLLATAAINAQMVIDLGAMYQQKFSLQQAQTVAGAMGSLMLKLGLVELSTQTIGSILKGNAITFVAGGAVQGVSAAYLTRLAGMCLIEYFQAQEASITAEGHPFNIDQLKETLQRVFQQNQRTAFLQSFVKQAVGRILPESQQGAIAGS
jgi:GTPase SAR1 family protein